MTEDERTEKRKMLKTLIERKAEKCRSAAQQIEEELDKIDGLFTELKDAGYHDDEEIEELELWAAEMCTTIGDLGSDLKSLRISTEELKPETVRIVRVS